MPNIKYKEQDMNRKMRLPRIVWGTALIFMVATPAMAMDGFNTSSAYVGLGGGRSENKDLGNDKDNAWRAFVGYDFNKFFALEAGYVDLGATESGSTNARIRGPELVGILSLPVTDEFAIFAKGGAHRLETKTSNPFGSSTDRDTRATYGAGLKYAFNNNVSVRGELERFEVSNNNTNLVSASLVFHFK